MIATRSTVLVVLFALCGCLALLTERASGAAPRTITFELDVDSRLSGGLWLLTASGGLDEAGGVLRTGTLADAARPLAVSLPVSEALRSAQSGHFEIHVSKTLDASHALVAVATAGLLHDRVAAGGTIDLGSRTATAVRTYPTVAEAVAASSCGTPCTPARSTGVVLGDESSVELLKTGVATTGVRARSYDLKARSAQRASASAQATSSQPAAPSPLPLSCDNGDLAPCGSAPVPSLDVDCDPPGLGVSRCVLESFDIHGVLAYRGNSYRPVGARSTFSVQEAAVQRWDDGYRAQAGAFSVSGQTEREVGEGSTTTYPLRGDCWSPANPNDGPTCDPWGIIWGYGRDTWRWEKVQFTACSPLCVVWTEERTRELTYDGGTTRIIDWAHFDDGWFEPLSALETGTRGTWTDYDVGSTYQEFADDKVTESFGAAIEVALPNSYGAAEFRSSVEHQVLERVINEHQLRPVTELPFIAKHYRYDWGYSHFKYDYWTCEFAPGNTGGPCFLYGT